MTLTFDLATWFLFAIHRLVMMIICVKLFSNPTMHNKVMGMHNKVMGRTQTSFCLCAKGGGLLRLQIDNKKMFFSFGGGLEKVNFYLLRIQI